MDTIRGQVDSVRLVRDGWGILQVLAGSAQERTEVTGHPLGVEVGDTVECDGAWRDHPRYGRQFRAKEIRVVVPTDASGAIAWMLSRLPAIGRKLATEMVERWPLPEVWHVLEHEPEELLNLRGITHERLQRIHEAYMRLIPERDRIVAFKRFGLTDRQIARIQTALGDNALETIRRDPYVLIEEVDGFGWQRADGLARAMGLPHDHPSRIRAAVLHLLDEAAGAGHVYVPAGRLVARAARVLGVEEPDVRREANQLLDSERLVRRGAAVYRPRLAAAEAGVAESVQRLLGIEASEVAA